MDRKDEEIDLDDSIIEAWLDDHPDFTQNYFLRKATSTMVNSWLADRVVNIASEEFRNKIVGSLDKLASGKNDDDTTTAKSDSGSTGRKTPRRKISVEEINPRHLPLKPMVSKDELGSPSFYTPADTSPTAKRRSSSHSRVTQQKQRTRRISHYHMKLGPQLPGSQEQTNTFQESSELAVIDERDMIMELVKDIAMDLDITSVSHRILQNVSILLDADRGSLFLVREKGGDKFLVSRLFDVNKDSSLEETMVRNNEIRIALGQGIAGLVALTGKTLNIPEAYQDTRFNQDIDKKTGYRTRSILCMPIRDSEKRIVGVAQVINKQSWDGQRYSPFTPRDEKIFASYLGFCGIAIHNAQMFEKSQLENRRNEVLLDLTKVLFEEQSSLAAVMENILLHTTSLLNCERSSILLVDSHNENVFKTTFEHVSEEFEPDTADDNKKSTRMVPINVDLTSYVRQTGLTVNISEASKEKRFQLTEDEQLGIKTKSLLCMPIRNVAHDVIGVIQLINKNQRDGTPFTTSDEQILEAFAIFCGLGICHAQLYEEKAKLLAKSSVVLEVLSYHAISSPDESYRICSMPVSSAKHFNLFSFEFDDSALTDEETLLACMRMFMEMNFMERFYINKYILCRWLCSVKKNYRPVKYHNWRHAFNVCQSMFCMIKTGGIGKFLNDFERLALLISCLCHDLDHRGTNNAFQAKIEHPLARLYSTSTLERHHYDQCLMLIQSDGCQILSHLTADNYESVIKLIQHAILSTDLAVYFRNRKKFLELANSENADWRENEEHRCLLRSVLITGCDIAAITKPWKVQKKGHDHDCHRYIGNNEALDDTKQVSPDVNRHLDSPIDHHGSILTTFDIPDLDASKYKTITIVQVARMVAEEFFDQGDIEKTKLHLQPMDMMDRNFSHKLPSMQIGFINSICLPLYEGLTNVSVGLKPMHKGCLRNRDRWESEAKISNV